MDRVVTFLLVGMWLTSLGCDASNDLDSVKPDDEDGGDLILPCLREVSRRFGAPAAAMRDLGKAMSPRSMPWSQSSNCSSPRAARHRILARPLMSSSRT